MKKNLFLLFFVLILCGKVANGQEFFSDSFASSNALSTKTDTISSPKCKHSGHQLRHTRDSSSVLLTHNKEGVCEADSINLAQLKHSVGLSWFSSFNGVSLKFNLHNQLYLQADIGAHAYLNFLFIPVSPTLGVDFGTQIYLLYENTFPRRTNVYWIAGGGLNFAGAPHIPYSKQVSLKGGAQVILGIECMAESAPLSVQVDTRWGYGVIYSTKGVKPWERNGFIPDNNPYHFLDYGFVVTLRYYFDKRTNH